MIVLSANGFSLCAFFFRFIFIGHQQFRFSSSYTFYTTHFLFVSKEYFTLFHRQTVSRLDIDTINFCNSRATLAGGRPERCFFFTILLSLQLIYRHVVYKSTWIDSFTQEGCSELKSCTKRNHLEQSWCKEIHPD